MSLKLEASLAFFFRDTNNRIKGGSMCLCVRVCVCVSMYSGNTDVIAGSIPISLEGNSVIIPTPGHNGLLKQQWTE